MNPEIFIHYGNRLRTKSKRVYRKSLKAIAVSKRNAISTANTTIHYAKEIRIQSQNFKRNLKHINRYERD